MTASRVTLASGETIPPVGLGTWPLTDTTVAPVIVEAVELGYRHIDTAFKYENESGVGQGIRDCGLPRGELFITTKLDGTFQGEGRALKGIEGSLRRLGLDYVDLLLIHWPVPQEDRYVSTWRTFERIRSSGHARSIGVSNFMPEHLERLRNETGTVPAVNQIQLNPYISRAQERAYHSLHGIVTTSWGPLGQGNGLLTEPLLARIARKYGKTPGQIALRWHMDLGLVAIPKSANRERLRQNLNLFDFALEPADLLSISALDRGPGAGVDSNILGH